MMARAEATVSRQPIRPQLQRRVAPGTWQWPISPTAPLAPV